MDFFIFWFETHPCGYIKRHNKPHTSPSLWLWGCQATPNTSTWLQPCNLLWYSHTHQCTRTTHCFKSPALFCKCLTSEVDEVTWLCYLCLSKLMTLPKEEVWKENRNFTGHQMTVWSFPTNFLARAGQRNLDPYRGCASVCRLWSLVPSSRILLSLPNFLARLTD